MSDRRDKPGSRRDFLVGVVRGAALGAIAVVSTALLARKRLALPDQKCCYRGFCRDCRAFDKCKLPQAMTIKRGGVKK